MSKLKDLTGKRYGRLFVTDKHKRVSVGKSIVTKWLCKCDCGNEKWVKSGYLINRQKMGKDISCGCHGILDMSGMIFGEMTVSKNFKREGRRTLWECDCSCGNKIWVDQGNLKRQRSCGCEFKKYMREKMKGEFGLATKRNVYCDYRKSAKYRKYSFLLNFNTFIDITQQNCYYCGCFPSNIEKSKYKNGDFVYNGIDRINNAKGYGDGNVVACCWKCNQMKGKMDCDDFIGQVVKISNNVAQILLDTECRMGYNPCVYETRGLESKQIDEEADFEFIQTLLEVRGLKSPIEDRR